MFLYIKILHLLSLISWMVGLFYLPRLFVYHTENKGKTNLTSVFEVMEYKLYTYIMTPAHLVTYISGLCLAITGEFMKNGWLHGKILCVIFLSIFHFYLNHCRKELAHNVFRHSSKTYRLLNEVPTLILIVILILVVLKP